MSETDQDTKAPKPSELIPGFEYMDVAQTAFNQYLVTSPAGDDTTGYIVDLSVPDCQCRDMQMRNDGDHVCKHILKAAYHAETIKSMDQEAGRLLSQRSRELREATDRLERAVTGHEADRAENATEAGSRPADEPTAQEDPVEALYRKLDELGVSRDEVDAWVDDEYNSLQFESQGIDSDDAYGAFMDWVTDDDSLVNWDRNNGRNYIKRDDLEEALG